MGFSQLERVNIAAKALQAGVIDANPNSVWYEVFFPFTFILSAEQVWAEMPRLRGLPASSRAIAQANAAANTDLIQDLTADADALQMTLVPGTNNSTYAAYSTPGDTSSDQLKNWLLPQLVQQASGAPSNGYAIYLYNGDPAAGGTMITTTEGTTGTGSNKTVGWTFNYANGLLLFSSDFFTVATIDPATFDPYITGFRYVGKTAGDGGGSDAEYVTLATDPDLPNARVLTEGTGIDITDGGAGNPVTVSLEDTAVTPGTYKNAEVEVDQQGRIISATANVLTEGTGIDITEGVGTTTFALTDTGVTAAKYENATVTIDEKGRVIAAESGTGSTTGMRSSFVKPPGWPF